MPPKFSHADSDCGQCNLCDKPLRSALRPVVMRRSRATTFQCTKCRGPMRGAWHVTCVVDQFDAGDSEVDIRCPACDVFVTARREPGWWWKLAWFAWASYPQLAWWMAPAPIQFALNRILDVVALIVGFIVMAALHAAMPYTGHYEPGVGEHIVYNEMPRQFERLRAQATNEHNSPLALATFVAAWVTGWNAISAIINTCSLAWILFHCRRRQKNRGIVIQ